MEVGCHLAGGDGNGVLHPRHVLQRRVVQIYRKAFIFPARITTVHVFVLVFAWIPELKPKFQLNSEDIVAQTQYGPVIKERNPKLIIMFGTPNFSARISETIDIQKKCL